MVGAVQRKRDLPAARSDNIVVHEYIISKEKKTRRIRTVRPVRLKIAEGRVYNIFTLKHF